MNIQEIKESLATTKTSLKGYNQEIKSLLANPDVMAWRKVDFKKFGKDLQALDMPAKEIISSITICKQLAKKFLADARVLMDAVANLNADIIDKFDEATATSDSQKITAQLDAITGNYSDFQSKIKYLIKAKAQLNSNLQMKNIFNSVTKNLGSNRSLKPGLAVYEFFIAEQTSEDSQGLADFKITGDKLETRFKNLEITGLPMLAEEIVHHQLEVGTDTLTQAMSYLKRIEPRFKSESEKMKLLGQKISNLQNAKTITTALIEVNRIKKSFGDLIIHLAKKYYLLENVQMVSETFCYLNVFHLTTKNSLLPEMVADLETNSIINPVNFAEDHTSKFFSGIKGMMHSFKMMYTSMKGSDALNAGDLQTIIEKAIFSCRIYYGTSSEDIKKLSSLINGLLKDYAKPFPHEPLFKLVKECIAQYGENVEKYLSVFKVDSKYRNLEKTKVPNIYGKLSQDIIKRGADFTKLVSGM